MKSQKSTADEPTSESTSQDTTSRRPKRKISEISQASEKRTCLGLETSKTNNRDLAIKDSISTPSYKNIYQLLRRAAILVTAQEHLNEIQTIIPRAVYFDISEANKENSPQQFPLSHSMDHVVLVKERSTSMRTVLRMVKQASLSGTRYHVYNWKVVKCVNGNTEINWRNEHFWTYLNGKVLENMTL